MVLVVVMLVGRNGVDGVWGRRGGLLEGGERRAAERRDEREIHTTTVHMTSTESTSIIGIKHLEVCTRVAKIYLEELTLRLYGCLPYLSARS